MKFLKRTKKPKFVAPLVEKEAHLRNLEADAAKSRQALLDVATQTKEIAEDITLKLRNDLIDTMRQLELTANIISDALMICAQDGTIITMNAAAETLLQRSVLSDTICLYDHIKLNTVDYWGVLAAVEGQQDVVRGDGVSIACTINVTGLDKLQGERNYIVLIHVIGEDETIETAAIIRKGAMIVRDGFITAVNDELETVLGYESDELLGMPLAMIISPSEQAFVDTHMGNDQVETSFDTTMISKQNQHLYAKMAVSFLLIDDKHSTIVSIESIGDEVMDRKIDVIRCFGEDFFFRSSTYISQGDDMFLYLTPDLTIKFASETIRHRLSTDVVNLAGVPLKDVLSSTEFKIAQLHFESLSVRDFERTISMHLKNSNSGAHQEWTDRAFFNDAGEVIEYRRTGRYRAN